MLFRYSHRTSLLRPMSKSKVKSDKLLIKFFFNNTLSNATVNAASNISYRLLLEAGDTSRCDRPMSLQFFL